MIRKRQQLGIPSFVRPTVRIQWKIPWLRLLGRRPDRELARQLGVRASSVKRKREELGIAPYRYSGPVARTKRLKELLKRPTAELHQDSARAWHHFTIGSGEAPRAGDPGVVAL